MLLRLFTIKLYLRFFRSEAELIGVSLLAHMGDIVASEPVIRRLRADNPKAFIVWFVGAPYIEIPKNHPDVDMVIGLKTLSEWIVVRGFCALDRIIDLNLSGRTCYVCRVTLVKPEDDSGINIENYYLMGNLLTVMLRSAGLPAFDEGPKLNIPSMVLRDVDRLTLPARFICIHGLSNENARNWSAAKWRELVDNLTRERGYNVVEIGLESVLGDFAHPRYTSLCGRLSIVATAEVIRRADIFVGVDSGPAHLANAVGAYGIVLLGKYRNFPAYMPYSGDYGCGSNATILRYDGSLDEMPVNMVLAALNTHMELRSEVAVKAG
ncbi:glycosyltransferase family 9 protein [Pseudothauera rhizosphaerae]|uniref:Glycosyltransferase family 9 protein n=1 Tax=Pseudothauera rhizosphaerae TaxID=2565932 RepID=A0A4S4ABY6_9RHOO|nr:glycosyltransferase family 9 protein [Pseudothauera rhizosphaerae]THF56181.1 glycosyltransferase family 9 protein [Pseudothauera rhizosphaerae]